MEFVFAIALVAVVIFMINKRKAREQSKTEVRPPVVPGDRPEDPEEFELPKKPFDIPDVER